MTTQHTQDELQPGDAVARGSVDASLSNLCHAREGIVNAVRFHFALWLGCALLLFFAALTICMRKPWDPDELRYLQITAEMKGSGTLFEPRLWGELYLEKPPVFFWFVLLGASVFGELGLAALLAPAVLTACGGLWLAARISRRWWGERAGVYAAAVLATLPLYLLCATLGRMDMPFSFAITLATWWFYLGYVEGRRWARLEGFGAVGVAVIIKGPLGVLFPLATVVAFLAITGRLRRLIAWDTLAGLAVSLMVLAAWLVPAVVELGPDYLMRLIDRHLFVAAVDGKDHPQSPFFYVPAVPVLWMPWTVFAPAALWAAWRRWRTARDERDLWLLCWIGMPLLVLTAVRQKLYIYLLPTMPPFAIAMGRYWVGLLDAPDAVRRMRLPGRILFSAGVLGGALFVAGGWLVQAGSVSAWRGELDGILASLTAPRVLYSAGGMLLTISLVCWFGSFFAAWRGNRFAFGRVAAASISAFLVLHLIVYPALDDDQSWWPVARALQARRTPGEKIITYRLSPYVAYYLRDTVICCRQPAALSRLLEEHETILSAVPGDRLDEVVACGEASFDRAERFPSPKGPVYIVRLRQGTTRDDESSEAIRLARESEREPRQAQPAPPPPRGGASPVADGAPDRPRKPY